MNVHSDERRVMLTARLLGRLWVVVDGQVVDTVSSRRTRNVLAYLLTHRETPVPRDVLMDVFWGNADPEAARNSVHVALSGVRRALRATGAEPLLERHHDTYRFADRLDAWVDVEAFEQATRQGRREGRPGFGLGPPARTLLSRLPPPGLRSQRHSGRQSRQFQDVAPPHRVLR